MVSSVASSPLALPRAALSSPRVTLTRYRFTAENQGRLLLDLLPPRPVNVAAPISGISGYCTLVSPPFGIKDAGCHVSFSCGLCVMFLLPLRVWKVVTHRFFFLIVTVNLYRCLVFPHRFLMRLLFLRAQGYMILVSFAYNNDP